VGQCATFLREHLEVTSPISTRRPQRLRYYTALRYPGGKGKLAAYVKALIKTNSLFDGEYVEPYCGGAAVALELLFHEYVWRVHINDISRPIYAFWRSVLDHTDDLSRLIRDTPLTVRTWDRQKRIFSNGNDFSLLELGFATLFLNRTNRSGVFNAGVIGGRDQTGPWKIDARFNRQELVFRIESIAKMRHRIKLTRMDAIKFLAAKSDEWTAKTLIYLDPPYYRKGRELYYDFYEPKDHQKIHQFLTGAFQSKRWIISYDSVKPIRELYKDYQRLIYAVSYSARSARKGVEVMFFSNAVQMSPLTGPLRLVESST
jgi:DNA adenine methylase